MSMLTFPTEVSDLKCTKGTRALKEYNINFILERCSLQSKVIHEYLKLFTSHNHLYIHYATITTTVHTVLLHQK